MASRLARWDVQIERRHLINALRTVFSASISPSGKIDQSLEDTVWVTVFNERYKRAEQFCVKIVKGDWRRSHRVFVCCKHCSTFVPFGRYHQHYMSGKCLATEANS